ncbi:MAG: rhomboid family intramembrane serine protease [Nanoarchaeota archaeon]|nr:rhomboid family intramembrane serine protease [Nanoarchaeota archaeon]
MKYKFYALKLCVVVFVIFLVQLLIPKSTEYLILNEFAWVQIWRFITAIFVHGNLLHLLYNLFALALFGSILEKLIGRKSFILVFLVSGVLSNLVSVNFYESSLGASGAIFGVIGALIIIRPLLFVWAFGIPMPIFIAGTLWALGDILGAYGFLVGNPMDNTGNIAHLSGMLFGFIFGMIYKPRKKKGKSIKWGIAMDEKYVRDWEDRNFR